MLFISAIGFSQAPSSAATTPPTRDAGDVISLFTKSTDASTTVYSDIAGINYNPNWGSTSGNVAEETLNGDVVMKYPAFHYQGIVIGQNVNLSAMTKMHVDIWTNSISPNVFLISATTGERSVNVAANPGAWSSVEIDLTEFSNQGMSINDIKELKFDGGDSTTDIYIDNIYFYRPAVDPSTDATLSDLQVDGNTVAGFGSATEMYTVKLPTGTTTVPTVTSTTTQSGANAVVTPAASLPGSTTVVVTAGDGTTQKTYTVTFEFEPAPTDAPATPPTYASNNVVSLYSDAYTAAAAISNVGWDDSAFEEVNIAGNNVLKVTGTNFLGMSLDSYVDATAMTHLHMDYWIVTDHSAGQVLNPKLSNHAAQAGETNAIDISNPINNQSEVQNWQSKDFALTGDRQSIKEFLITVAGKAGVYYLDNVYMYVQGTASARNNDLLKFSMYPNPARNVLNISAAEIIERAEIFNVLGKRVMSTRINNTRGTVDVSELSSGIYLIKYNVNDKVGTAKFIKQ